MTRLSVKTRIPPCTLGNLVGACSVIGPTPRLLCTISRTRFEERRNGTRQRSETARDGRVDEPWSLRRVLLGKCGDWRSE